MSEIEKEYVASGSYELFKYVQSHTNKKRIINEKLDILNELLENWLDNAIGSIKNLPYTEMKPLYEMLSTNVSFEINKKLKDILLEAKLKAYPMLAKAYHYPVLNDIDFLSEEWVKQLDVYLKNLKVGSYIHVGSSAWIRLASLESLEKENRLLEFLIGNKIVEKVYKITCNCSDEIERNISQQEYDEFVDYHKGEHDECWLEDNSYKGYMFVCCVEVDAIDLFYRYVKVHAYKLIMSPDLSLDLL